MLLNKGPYVNAMQGNGTALHIVAQYGYHEVVKQLLRSEAEFDCKTMDDLTPMHASHERVAYANAI